MTVLALVALPAAASKGVEGAGTARIAFIEGRNAIYTVLPDGTGKRRVTPRRRPHDTVDGLEWSPDGRRLVYVWNDLGYPRPHAGYADLFVISAIGGKPRPVAKTGSDEINPAWSPDGTKIAYDRYDDGYWSVWVVNADGTHTRRLTPGIFFAGPAWSADGRKLACSDRRGRAYTMNADGTGRRRVASLRGGAEESAAVAWSPKGRRLAFLSGYELWLVDRPGATPRQLVEGNSRTRNLRWSPDGHQIAYTRTVGGDGEIFVIDVDTAKVRQLTDNKVVDEEPSWSPDSQAIAFSRGIRDAQIYVMNADGSNQRNISSSPTKANYMPHWAPRG